MTKPIPQIVSFDFDSIKSAVRIEPSVLNEEFVRLPSDLAYWNEVYANAVGALLDARRKVEETEALVYKELKSIVDDKGKAPTEAHMKANVTDDLRLKLARQNEDEAEVTKVRASGVVEAIRAKRDMLISLGAHIRAEMLPVSLSAQDQRLRDLERRASER